MMMDVHEADGVIPSDTEGEDDSSTSSSSTCSASSTMMFFDKPQPLVLELHELKKTDHSPNERQITVPLEKPKSKKQVLTSVNEKARKLKKKRKTSNASKLTPSSDRQSQDALELGTPLPTDADLTKEEFFDAQDTVMPPLETEPTPDSSTPFAISEVAPIMDSVAEDLDLELPRFTSSIVTPPWAKPVNKSEAEAKIDVSPELIPPAVLAKDMSHPNVTIASQPHSVTAHRSANALSKPLDDLQPPI